MKYFKNIIKTLLFLSFFAFTCCSYPPEEPEISSEVLVSYEPLTGAVIPTDYVDQLLMSGAFPDFMDNRLTDATLYGVHVYKIIYKTTYKNNPIQASGAVVIPVTSEPLPILSYQHGTIFHDSRAPSNFNTIFDMDAEMALNLFIASTGFVCSIPDYIGYGQSGNLLHPFQHAQTLATASVDMLKATKELCQILNTSLQNRYFLTGYSEGGYATLALQREIEKGFASQFPLIAVTAGAGAYDLRRSVDTLIEDEFMPVPAYPCFLANGYSDAEGWTVGLDEIFRQPYAERIEGGLLNGDYWVSEINEQLTYRTAELFTESFMTEFRGEGQEMFKEALRVNGLVEGWLPQAPTRLYHGTSDLTVPAFNSETAAQTFISGGAPNIEYFPLTNRNHETGIFPWVKETILWFTTLRN